MSFKHPPLTPDSAPFDDDNPEWTEEMFAKARPPAEVLAPEILAAFKTHARPPGQGRAEGPRRRPARPGRGGALQSHRTGVGRPGSTTRWRDWSGSEVGRRPLRQMKRPGIAPGPFRHLRPLP